MTEIEGLATVCEQAAGPDSALDFQIAEAVGCAPGLTYTESLDAAMTLVPEGSYPQISKVAADAWQVNIGFANRAKGIVTKAATPALALCAAALRARTQGGHNG